MKNRATFGALLAVLGLVAIGFIGAQAATSQVASAHTAANYGTQAFGEDRLYRHDFHSRTLGNGNVDWGVSFLFTNNAEVDKVKDKPNEPRWCGGRKEARFRDSSSYEWDPSGDKGIKTNCTFVGDVYHLRVYGDENDKMWSPTYKYWVFGTVHIDHDECCSNKWFGENEKAENKYDDEFGNWTVYRDSIYMATYQWNDEGNHRWRMGSWATQVIVP